MYIKENDTPEQKILDQEETHAKKTLGEWSVQVLIGTATLLFMIPIYFETLAIPFYSIAISIYVISLIKLIS